MKLVTGGTGYIGSHTVVGLMEAVHDVFIVGNYCNSKPSLVNRIVRVICHRLRFQELDKGDDK